MAVAIRLPDMGTNVAECKLLGWRIKPGEAVKRGDVLADIETDKAEAELQSTKVLGAPLQGWLYVNATLNIIQKEASLYRLS